MKDIVTQLRANSECLAPSIMLEAADEIERLRAERDKLQREICDWVSLSYEQAPEEVARRYGFDCFKEKAP
jgi:cell division protein FtsB